MPTMKPRRIIINVMLALTLMVAGGITASMPAYAASGKGGSKPAAKGGGGGGKKGGAGGGGGGGGGSSCPADSTSKGQVLQGLGVTGSDCSDSQVNHTLQLAGTLLALVVGIAAVFAIMSGAFKYITSGGDQNKVANAKSTLIYALVGIAVAGLTEFLIHFVLFQTAKT